MNPVLAGATSKELIVYVRGSQGGHSLWLLPWDLTFRLQWSCCGCSGYLWLLLQLYLCPGQRKEHHHLLLCHSKYVNWLHVTSSVSQAGRLPQCTQVSDRDSELILIIMHSSHWSVARPQGCFKGCRMVSSSWGQEWALWRNTLKKFVGSTWCISHFLPGTVENIGSMSQLLCGQMTSTYCIPIPLPTSDACKIIPCPLLAGNQYNFSFTLPVLMSYPTVWKLHTM